MLHVCLDGRQDGLSSSCSAMQWSCLDMPGWLASSQEGLACCRRSSGGRKWSDAQAQIAQGGCPTAALSCCSGDQRRCAAWGLQSGNCGRSAGDFPQPGRTPDAARRTPAAAAPGQYLAAGPAALQAPAPQAAPLSCDATASVTFMDLPADGNTLWLSCQVALLPFGVTASWTFVGSSTDGNTLRLSPAC